MTAQIGLRDQVTRLTPELRAEYEASGLWRRRSLHGYLSDAARAVPDQRAAISVDGTTGAVVDEVTYAELADLSGRVAAGLIELGIGPGDTVAVMLTNRLEFSAIVYGIHSLGAIYTGIPIRYSAKEAAFMVRRSRAKVLFVPNAHRRVDYVAIADELLAAAPGLERIVVVGASEGGRPAFLSFTELVDGRHPRQLGEIDAGDLAHIGFTSGTTGEPKGVMNTHQTLDAVSQLWIEHVGPSLVDGVANLIASPVGHHTGYLWGALFTAEVRGTAVYVDQWRPAVAVKVIEEQRIAMLAGAPTFLQDLVQASPRRPDLYSAFRLVVVAGAPIPRILPARAREQFECLVCPAWGMTEWGIGISGAPGMPQERVDATDGKAVRGCQVRVVDDHGLQLTAGEVGHLQMTGPGLFLGYYDRPDFTAEALDHEWFHTGDRAFIDADGYVSLVGRSKDIIIRGGENISVYDLKNALFRHPAVADAAVIGVADDRLGERICAVVVAASTVGPEELTAFCLAQGVSKHHLPERIEFVDELPKTLSGKVKKFELRHRFSAAPTRA